MERNRNIVLIGMPGVGKSTVGVVLAKRLGYSFLDTDIYLQTSEGKSLQKIIRAIGTSRFCDLEERHVLSISVQAHVIATGGSVVYRQKAMDHLRGDGTIIHLDLGLGDLKKRLDDIDARGVVIAPGLRVDDLYAERHPLYLRYADATIETKGCTPDEVVGKIVVLLQRPKAGVQNAEGGNQKVNWDLV
jgi:shikimate kinase